MTAKQQRPTEEARRRLQHDKDTQGNAVPGALGSSEVNDALDKAFTALSVPKGGRSARKMAAMERRFWPSANSQRAPSRPMGTKKSPR